MKTAYAAVLGIVALLLSACVTGDEITSYVIDPDGSIEFSTYRNNLTSSEAGEDAKMDLANYIQRMEEKSGDLFTKLVEANAQVVQVTILRRASPASVLITGRIPSLNDFAVFMTEKADADHRFVCTAISKECVQGIRCELTHNSSNEELPADTVMPEETKPDATASNVDPINATRFVLAKGAFIKAQGFLLAPDKRSAAFDEDTLSKIQTSSITVSLEWQSPEVP
jgi:hypothetical protein